MCAGREIIQRNAYIIACLAEARHIILFVRFALAIVVEWEAAFVRRASLERLSACQGGGKEEEG